MNIKFPETLEQEMNDPHNEFDSWTGRSEFDANLQLAETARNDMSNDLNDTLRQIARLT